SAGPRARVQPRAGPKRTPSNSAASSPKFLKGSPLMPVEVRVPVLGESVVEATVGAWLKHEGEAVDAGESLVQLETEKVNVDVAADQAGVLGKISRQEGETVHPGDVLAVMDDSAATTAPRSATDSATPATEATLAPAAEVSPSVSEADRPHA